jgi:hypothetical protein
LKIFGGWLPFIGFREEPIVSEDMRRFFDLPPGTKTMNSFQIEWLHNGLIIPLPDTKEDDE